jgi:hypothetical protein
MYYWSFIFDVFIVKLPVHEKCPRPTELRNLTVYVSPYVLMIISIRIIVSLCSYCMLLLYLNRLSSLTINFVESDDIPEIHRSEYRFHETVAMYFEN